MGGIEARQRDHSWDAARAFLMVLGIPYHTALAYRAGRPWIVNSGEGLPVFTYVAEVIHLFRMPAFFLIAGYFAALLLSRRPPGAWLRGRFRRLGIPLIASLVTLVPLLNLACELSNLPLAEALASWRHNTMTSGGYWVRHLWFLIVLLYCCSAAAALAWWRPSLRVATLPPRIDRWVAQHLFACLLTGTVFLGLWEAAAVELFYKAGLATNLPQEILRLDEFLTYAPYFLAGALMARAPLTLQEMGRFSPGLAAVAAISVLASLLFLDNLPPMAGRFIATFAAVAVTQAIIAGAKRLGDRPIPMVQKVVSASFVMYLVHMPIIIVLVWLGQHVQLPVASKALTVMMLSLLLSYGAWLVACRSTVLAFLFNGDLAPARLRPAAA